MLTGTGRAWEFSPPRLEEHIRPRDRHCERATRADLDVDAIDTNLYDVEAVAELDAIMKRNIPCARQARLLSHDRSIARSKCPSRTSLPLRILDNRRGRRIQRVRGSFLSCLFHVARTEKPRYVLTFRTSSLNGAMAES